jgi:hypothetical protein
MSENSNFGYTVPGLFEEAPLGGSEFLVVQYILGVLYVKFNFSRQIKRPTVTLHYYRP